jgi:hypothetical protein
MGLGARKLLTLIWLAQVALFAVAPPGSAREGVSQTEGYGEIEGTVVDESGAAVADATVYVLERGRSPSAVTDASGRFLLSSVKAGSHRIFAFKEADGFPNPVWSFYNEASGLAGFPTLDVQADQRIQGVTVQLGPKASLALIKVSDAKTKRAVAGAGVALNHTGKPMTLFVAGATNDAGELAVLIPSSVAVDLKVTAPGYEPQVLKLAPYGSGNGIRLKESGATNLNIEIRPRLKSRGK